MHPLGVVGFDGVVVVVAVVDVVVDVVVFVHGGGSIATPASNPMNRCPHQQWAALLLPCFSWSSMTMTTFILFRDQWLPQIFQTHPIALTPTIPPLVLLLFFQRQ